MSTDSTGHSPTTTPAVMKIGLETFSYHMAFHLKRMDVFGFIERAHALGLDGVQIHMGNAVGSCYHLGGTDPQRLAEVRAMARQYGLYVEADCVARDVAGLTAALDLCEAIGADRLRTYASTTTALRGAELCDYMSPGGGLDQALAHTVDALREVAPIAADRGIRIGLENHEYETAAQVVRAVEEVASPWVGILIDTGNMMTVWEDPAAAIQTMLPHVVMTHFKDHAVIEKDGEPVVVGTTLGRGGMDCAACWRLLAGCGRLERINIEVCYGYATHVRKPPAPGDSGRLGEGAFRVMPPPLSPAVAAPHPLYNLAEHEPEQVLAWHDAAVVESVSYVQRLRGDGGGARAIR